MTRPRGRRRGFTLAEIMVAMSIFLMMGGMLLLALRTGVDTWSRTEERRRIYEDAQALLRQLRRDLSALCSTGGSRGDARVRLLCDFDRHHRPRLRLVRSLRSEEARTEMRLAGTGTEDEGYTGFYTETGGGDGKLRPLGGRMEVAYLFDPDDPSSTVLYRGVRSPIGGEGSLFRDGNLDTGEKVRQRLSPVLNNVLHLGFSFWSQFTTTWDPSAKVSNTLGTASGPEFTWDSTRGILPRRPKDRKGKDPNFFTLARNEASREVTADDIFPRQVQVVLVLRPQASFGLRTELVEDLGRTEKDVRVASARGFPDETDPPLHRYLRVGGEWMHFTERRGDVFRVDARGARSTAAASHRSGAYVYAGRTFVTVVSVPAYREFWYGANPMTGTARDR